MAKAMNGQGVDGWLRDWEWRRQRKPSASRRTIRVRGQETVVITKSKAMASEARTKSWA